MKIPVSDESSVYLASWWSRKGERYIAGWLTLPQAHKRWFENMMVKRYGDDWEHEED